MAVQRRCGSGGAVVRRQGDSLVPGKRWTVLSMGVMACVFGSCQVDLLEDVTLFPQGTEFVLTGTATVLDNGGPCLAWLGENGVTYHLFQATHLDNADFDRVTTPGATSRLVIATRTDLEVRCATGTIIEVRELLEIVE